MKKVYLFVAYVCLAIAVDLAMTETIHAQDAASAVQAQAAAAAQQPAAAIAVQPAAVSAPASVVVPEPAAPPSWASDLLLTISKLPVVGPFISKALLYLGILAAILTTLVAAALSILGSLKGAFNAAGLDNAAAAIAAFQKGKIMYWLTYFSNFNAKKSVA